MLQTLNPKPRVVYNGNYRKRVLEEYRPERWPRSGNQGPLRLDIGIRVSGVGFRD